MTELLIRVWKRVKDIKGLPVGKELIEVRFAPYILSSNILSKIVKYGYV